MIGMSFPCPRLGGNQGGPTFTGILDQLSTQPIHAWSHARVLSAAWLGNPIIRLRRDSDSEESDFGADDAGDLDTAAIATFLGADTAHVAKIYDQVGSVDLLQAEPTRQFVYSSSLAALNGRAVASMAGGNGFMTAAYSIGDATAGFYGVFHETTPSTNFPRFVTSDVDGVDVPWVRVTNARGFFSSSMKSNYPTAVTLPQAFYFGSECDGVNNKVYYRGQGQTAVAYSTAFTFTSMYVGSNSSFANPAAGAFAEMYTFAAPASGADRAIIEANQVAYYGLTPL